MKKIIFTLLFAFSLFSFHSCNDCPLQEIDPVTLCKTGIVTLERFNPNFTIIPGPNPGDERIVLDSDYSISIFQFSSNTTSTGSLPNDNRFQDRMLIPLASSPFVDSNQNYLANIMDTYPTNANLAGDILVRDIDVTTNPPLAYLRIYGSIDLIDQNFVTENAQQFCEYVRNNRNRIQNSFNNYTEGNRYGTNQPGAIISNYDNYPIIITNSARKIIGTVGSPNVPVPPNNVITELRTLVSSMRSIDIRVVPGNVFTYIAGNGRRFVIMITEIRQTNITPFRKRITLMLNPVDN